MAVQRQNFDSFSYREDFLVPFLPMRVSDVGFIISISVLIEIDENELLLTPPFLHCPGLHVFR